MNPGALSSVAASIATTHRGGATTIVVGLSGGVAAGKTTIADEIARSLAHDHGLAVAVVSTDGFLFPNARLAEMGILDRKGFPESYDVDAVHRFLDEVLDGRVGTVPVYDHLVYDIVDEVRAVEQVDVLVFEGVNALRFDDRLDRTIYLHAEEPDLRRWFTDRAFGLRAAARHTHSPFFAPWVDTPDEDFRAMTAAAWDLVNRPNLVECIEPTRVVADTVIVKAGDHTVTSIEFRTDLRRRHRG